MFTIHGAERTAALIVAILSLFDLVISLHDIMRACRQMAGVVQNNCS